MYPEAKNAGQWLRHGWHVAVAYIVAYLAMVMIVGWHPEPLNKHRRPAVEILLMVYTATHSRQR